MHLPELKYLFIFQHYKLTLIYSNYMLRTSLLIICLFTNILIAESNTPDSWTRKADYTLDLDAGTHYGVGFSIGNKGYFSTGRNFQALASKALWSYDPALDAWTQEADFGGLGRNNAVVFSVGHKAYLGTGWDVSLGKYFKDFWEYDPTSNAWTEIASLPGGERHEAVGFAIGNRGYVCSGVDSNFNYKRDLWEYNPANNNWIQKADLTGIPRAGAVGFGTNTKGYIGTGYDGSQSRFKDFWEYNQATNSWAQIPDLPGTERSEAIAFTINGYGFVTTGRMYSGTFPALRDLYEYDPANLTWTQKANLTGTQRTLASGFSIGNKGYVGIGWDGNFAYLYDFWEYTPDLTTGSDDFQNSSSEKFGVSPNPNNGSFFLQSDQLKNVSQSCNIEVFTMTGKKIYFQDHIIISHTNTTSINIPNAQPGTYLLKVKKGNQTSSTRFIIE